MTLLSIRQNRMFVKEMQAFIASPGKASRLRRYLDSAKNVEFDCPSCLVQAGFSEKAARKAMRIRKKLEPMFLFSFTDDGDFHAKIGKFNKSSRHPALLKCADGAVYSVYPDGYGYSVEDLDGSTFVFRQKNDGRKITLLDGRFCAIEVGVPKSLQGQPFSLLPGGKVAVSSVSTLSAGIAVDVAAEQKAINAAACLFLSAGFLMLKNLFVSIPCFWAGMFLRHISTSTSQALGAWEEAKEKLEAASATRAKNGRKAKAENMTEK